MYLINTNFRNYGIFKTQLNTGLRISDVLKIKYEDVFEENGNIKRHLILNEKKTGKKRIIFMNDNLKKVFKDLRVELDLVYGDYFFKSRKGNNRPITTTQAHRIFQNIGKVFNLPNFNTHSLRKTFCYFVYQKNKDINIIMKMMNHSSPAVTLRYIGIADSDIDAIYDDVML